MPSLQAPVFYDSKNNFSSWLVDSDSGASYHIGIYRKLFVFIWKKPLPVDVSIGHSSKLTAKFEGHVEFVFTTSYGKFPVQLWYLMYLATSNVNLLSVSQDDTSGYVSRFEGDCCTIYNVSSGEQALKLDRTFRSYVATVTVQNVPDGDEYVVGTDKRDTSTFLWHKRLAHLLIRGMRQVLATAC